MWWHDIAAQAGDAGKPGTVRAGPSAEVSPDATFDCSRGDIVIGADSKICAGAHIEGPVTIGERCMIGNLARVRGSTTVGNDCRIGFATEIKNALIGARVAIGPQCFVADSKIEDGAYLGAQVRTSNHRLDGRNVTVVVGGKPVDSGIEKLGCLIGAEASLGIQVIVLPGREIAPGSLFAPRITIERNLPAGRYRIAQQLEHF